jgi:hypothetical protein
MYTPPFCPYAACSLHVDPPDQKWWSCDGFHATKAFGSVQRYVCHACGRTFSEQTFSVHFYAKFVIDFRRLERLSASSMSLRALSREFRCSCDSVTNRNDRIARQGIALHTTLRRTATTNEAVCFDGLVSFDRSQYFPSDIGLSITAKSRYIYAASHATTRRSGSMRDEQKVRRDSLYEGTHFERKAVERSFTEHLDLLADERSITKGTPLVLITDEKKEYVRAFSKHRLYLNQDGDHRCIQIQVPSTWKRTYSNPLFASNYLDREIRKDQANHRRETACHSRNPANSMSRLYSYIVWHNYDKRYLIKWPVHMKATAAEKAGISCDEQSRLRQLMFTRRSFLSHLHLATIDFKIWSKATFSPLAGTLVRGSLPAFAFG